MTPLSSHIKRLTTLSAKLLLAATLCASSLSALAQETNEPEALIKSITAPQEMTGREVGFVHDGKADTKYHTWDETDSNFDGEQYLEVTLKDALNLTDNEDLVVFLQRCDDCDNRQPTVFKVMGSESENPGVGDWEYFCRVYFLYRGKSTKEYSARIHTTKKFKKLRFYVIDNNTRSYKIEDKEKHYSMGLSEFEIFKVKRGGNYPKPLADQFHLRDDYNYQYQKYKFIPTMGWLDESNRSIENTTANQPSGDSDDTLNNEAFTKGTEKAQIDNITKLSNWAKWDEDWSKTGEWNLDTEKLLELGVEMPSLAPITNDLDFDSEANMQCQPTHVTEHILYAMPGDPIVLIPYGNFAEPKHFEKYEVNFAHWYDYRTGDKIIYNDGYGNEYNLLDFLADPWGVCVSEKNGFYGAYLMAEKKVGDVIHRPGRQSQNYGMSATFFCPRDPYIESGVAHSLPFREIDNPRTTNLEEEPEFVIAADFSQSFNKGRNLDTKNNQIIEPNIAFRHIFRIRDGKTLAEALSGTVGNNQNYIKRNRRDITARANKPFQIGLDVSVPQPWQVDGRWRSVPSEYYYKVSDTDYRRINAMRLRITGPDGGDPIYVSGKDLWENNENSLFYFGEPFDGLGQRDIEGVNYKISGGGVADRVGIYYRMLKTDKSLSGKYKVEIIGQEIIGEKEPTDIKIIGTEEPLVVMQFDIDFVANEGDPSPKAILVTSDKLHDESTFKPFRETEMVKKYGQAKDRIDFDYYRGLESLPTWKEYLDNRVKDGVDDKREEETSRHYQFRWPAAWSKSQYANGYSNDHNYNMYVVANHSSRTPYHNCFHPFNENDTHKDEETDGLYDRLHDKTERLNKADASIEVQNGYFLYVNAASDPGVMATLNVDNLCTGSTVHVSAYVAEFSKQFVKNDEVVVTEKANLVFNFVAVLENGDRINLHSFVSGYVSDADAGKWMNISYSFNPDVTRFNSGMVNHYELELENNCKSSDGADYAIDDISIYIVSPVVSAEQKSPLCTDVKAGQDNIVKISTPFLETLQSIDVAEAATAAAGKALTLQYVILDREKFDEAYEKADKEGNENPGLAAFETPGVVVGSGIGEQAIKFSSYAGPDVIPPYTDETAPNKAAIYSDPERNVRMLAFNTKFTDESFKVGKEYYISLYVTQSTDKTETAGWTEFDIKDGCSKYCVFKVKSKNNIRVDGEVRDQDGEISVCEGEAPVITVDIYTEDDKEVEDKHCDWFLGTREEYDAMQKDGIEFYKAYNQFRAVYPTAASPTEVEAKDAFTEMMRQYLIDNEDKLIYFYKESYKFPAIKIPEGEDTAEDVVLVLPIPSSDENVTVCTAPMEIHIYADMHSPKVLHGLRSGITYPTGMGNAPLRIGLDQLAQVRVENSTADLSGKPMLVVPIRTVETSGEVKNVKAMAKDTDLIFLETTTDPNYDLSTEIVVSESGEIYNILPETEAGKICSFKAQIDGKENALGAVFYKDFTFREGYEYTFGYKFKEVVAEADKGTKLCDGRTRFTIKVVPEYLVWTPTETSRNWNNDCNWKRVSSSDLNTQLADKDQYVDEEEALVSARLNDKVTDGSNAKVGAYMPMNFTKVIIPATNATVRAPFMYDWNAADETAKASAGAATENIEYDMVAKETESNVECDRWEANTCQQIHFLPEASIMNQQHLIKYEKAWIDLELSPSRWYTLAMPLKKVFAGEFYLPSATAKQQTELFQPITYIADKNDPNRNDRFNPAVFQRGWDKSEAKIYHPNEEDPTSAVVKANWSHVYNDVEEMYGSGVGFSIKADVSRFETTPDKVLFRLPKADTSYGYYDNAGNELDLSKRKNIDHGTDHYKLNEAEGTIKAENVGNKYFLVGNPFMTHLDMKAFLEANSGLVQQKYWMITAGTQKIGVFDPDSEGLIGNAEGTVAPMQGFFVEAISEVNSLELSYNEDMMFDASAASGSAPLKIASRSQGEGFTLTISAINDDEESTAAVVRVTPVASSNYVAEEDMVVIDNSDLEVRATVYTVGDGKALSVNSLDGIDNVELGLIALPEEETVLCFNTDADCALNLYDAATGAYTPIFDGMTYPVSGNAAGRLYLTATTGVKSIEASTISWSATDDELTVRSSDADCPRLSVRLIDYAGRIVAAQSVDGSEVTLPISAGVYVLEAESDLERICLQVKL